MCQIKSWNKFVVLLLMVQIVSGATRYVAKDGTADFTSIQEAIDASGTNDIVEILDNGIYEEQVNIDSTKTGLTLRATSILKPTIKWRDTLSTFPETPMEAQDISLTTEAEKEGIYFDQNGALRILRAQKITVEGIIIDGGGPYPFYGSGVWGAADLFHGNSALVLWISGDAVIRNCEMQNAYFGVAVKDRNLGGVFANVNPSDNDSTKNAPLSGFGKTGNHLFEQNRIHDNSWGMFFESAWDRGSVVRYNLFYENHHASSSFAEKVSGMGGEGGNQSGGAVLLKDVRHSPVAFYNNTFWHNIINIGGQWQAGAQHLIFNNIFGPPAELWIEDKIFGNNAENFAMDIAHLYRLKHNLYSVMKEWDSAQVYIGMNLTDPETGQNVQSEPQNVDVILPIISNDLRELEKGGYFNVTIPYSSGDVDTVIYTDNNQVISPGALILGKSAEPFPSDANNRWFEPVFKSTDPENPNFLVPDWNDTNMFKYVVDQGYPDAGVLDADGSIADLGAIPYNGELPSDKIVINPTKPVIISGSGGNTKATINFRMYSIAGEMKDPQIKYIRWIYKLPDQKDTWGKQADIIEREGIYIPTENPTVQMGLNTMALSIPALSTNDSTGFFEIIVEGTGSNGQKVTSSVGFIPYRELKYEFEIKVLDLNETTELDQVQVGTPVKMQIIPRKIDGTQLDKDITVDYVNLALSSIEYNLKDTSGNDLLFLTGLPVTGTIVPVMFTRIPDGGMEMITATGMFDTTSSEGFTDAIMGASDPIRILPGDPATIEFQDPPSGNKNYPGIIQPGELRETLLYVFDKYGNKVITPADVSVKSLSSEIGNFIGSKNGKSDESGEVIFDSLVVVNGTTDDVFAIEAKLVFNGKDLGYDTTYLKVGKITDRFVIFYSDTNGYNPTIIIDECSSERVPVTIRAMASENIIETRNTKFQIAFDKQGLAAYGSKTSSEPVTQATLVDGETVIWVQPNVPEIINGTIEIIPVDDRTILKGSRDGINFRYCDNPVQSAFYYTDYGNGAVNRIEIHFEDPLDEESIPDTMIFYWPDPSVERIVTSGMTIDSEDPSIMTIILEQPFDSLITARGSSPELGVCIRASEDIGSVNRQTFSIEEKVGPLLMSAIVVERLTEEGNDTLFLTFSEFVNYENLEGNSLILIKNETPITLNVLNAMFQDSEGDTIRVIVENTDNNLAPKEGDLLRINPEGPAKDNVGNFAHEDNRPVVIMQKEVPPDILSAYYYDKDGNGIVDTVIIEFNKAVKLEALSAEFTWAGKKTGKIESNHFSFVTGSEGLDNSRVAVDVSGRFQGIGIQTSGIMRLNLEYSSQTSAERVADVLDKAAPVITSAVYHPGAMAKGQPQPDTLNVTFSEKIADPGSSSLPFRFYRRANNSNLEYEIDLKQLGASGNTIRYLVNSFSVEEVEIAEKGDSVRIKTPDIYGDENGNLQNVPTNRLVPVEVKSVPVNFAINVGPNPFMANGVDYVTIKIDPQAKVTDVTLEIARVRIYDALGNIVFDENLQNAKAEDAEFEWDGRNLKGRYVGSGTYLAIVEAKVKGGESMKPSRHPIGIKR